MKKHFLVFGSATVAFVLSAFNTKEKRANPSAIYVAGAFSACETVSTSGFSNYFTLTAGTNQGAIVSISGAQHLLWQTSMCSGSTNRVFLNDPNQ